MRLSWLDVQAEGKVPLMSAQLGTNTARQKARKSPDNSTHSSYWQLLLDNSARFEVYKINLGQYCVEINQSKAPGGSLLDNYWTFGSPATGFDDPSNEALSLLLLMLPIHTLRLTHSAHQAVFPAGLTHQDLLYCIFIQHCLWKVQQRKKICFCILFCREKQFFAEFVAVWRVSVSPVGWC